MDHDFQSKTGRSALPASFSSFDQMPLRSRPTRARDTPDAHDARSLLVEEVPVTEETRARPLSDARSFLEFEAQEETGITPKSGTEEAEEAWSGQTSLSEMLPQLMVHKVGDLRTCSVAERSLQRAKSPS